MKLYTLALFGALYSSACFAGPTFTVLDASGCANPGIPIQILGTTFSTGGAQCANLNFAALAGLPPDQIGSLEVYGVELTGGATLLAPNVWGEATTGGGLNIWDAANVLQLALGFGCGYITESAAGAGSQFNACVTSASGPVADNYTNFNEAFSFVGLTNVGIVGGHLAPATARGNVVIDAEQVVPEPSTLTLFGSAGALGIGANLLIGSIRRRNNKRSSV